MRLAATMMAVVLGLTAASCGDNDTNDATPTSASTAPSTTVSTEDEVRAAYLAYWSMLERLSAAPNPDDPEIAMRASGDALTDVLEGLSRQVAEGTAARTGPSYRHSVLSVEAGGGRSVVRDCAVDDSTIVNAQTGETLGGGTAVTGLLEVQLVRNAGGWKVDSVMTKRTWAGETTCEP